MIEVSGPVPPARIRVHDDGRLEVLEAPARAEFALEALTQPNPAVVVDAAGHLELAGEVVYRPLAFRQDLSGRITLICERVR